MPNDITADRPAFLSPKEMQEWLLQELQDSTKAHELRVTSATEIATAYALGELTPEQAHERFVRHSVRWGEALPGTHAFKFSSDDQLLAAIDRVRGDNATATQTRQDFEKRFGDRSGRGSIPIRP
jgi:hypothetical protein